MLFDLDASRIVIRATRDRTLARAKFSGVTYGRAALGTKLGPNSPAALVGAVLMRLDNAAKKLESGFSYVDRDCEGTTRAPLTELAVARQRSCWFARRAETDLTANATAFLNLVHVGTLAIRRRLTT